MRIRTLARRLTGRGRPSHSAGGRAPAPDRLELRVDGGHAVVGVRLARAPRGVSELQLRSRSGHWDASYLFSEPDADGVARASVDLIELVRDRGLRETADLFVVWERTGAAGRTTATRRLGGFAETIRPPAAQQVEVDGVAARLEVTVRGNVSLRVDDDPGTGVRLTTTDPVVRDAGLELACDVISHNRALERARVVVFGRVTRTRIEADVSISHDAAATARDHGLLHFTVRPRVDLTEVARAMPAADELLDVFLELTTEGRDEPTTHQLRLAEGAGTEAPAPVELAQQGVTHLFLPYLTYRTRRLALRAERFPTADHRHLRRLLRVAWLFPLVKPFTRIWLVGELPNRAQDNGYHFFRWLRTERPRRRAYYVIEADSPDRDKLLPLGNVLVRGSRRHLLYSLLASRLIGSHHAEYLFASRHPAVQRWTRGVRVFLQHGITATKNVTAIYARQRTLELPTERFLVASELERRIVVEDYGYRPSQVKVTGFARFDALLTPAGIPERTVLVMPTWREGLRAATLRETDFFRSWHGFLSDPSLVGLLEEHGWTLRLVLHPNLRTLAEFFDLPHVELVTPGEIDVQQLLTSSAVLVTDFSSVAWDFAFLDRPVLYFPFDRAQLVGGRAPHIDLATDLPGPVATTTDKLVRELGDVLRRGGGMSEEHRARAARFLDHRDQRSCERIEAAVASAWRPSTALNRLRNARPVQRRWWRFRNGESYHLWMRRLYRLAAVLPRTDEVVFECDRGRHFGDSPRYLYERLVQRRDRPRIVWSNNTTLRLTAPGARKVQRYSPTYYWHLGRARYWVSNQNFGTELAKPTATRFLQTWHGTPLKRMQHDVVEMAGRDEGYQERAARLTSYWDVLLSGSPYATACFRSAFRFDGPILEEGYPRNDVFSWPDAAERAAAARQRLGLTDDHRTVVLYAPTFRDDNRPDVNWRHDLALDLPRLAAELGEDHVLVVRFHPLVRESLAAAVAAHHGFVIDASGYDDIQELMLVSDVLVTDYSSVFFDYAVLQRPILFFTYDLERYRDVLRGFYLDLEASAPGPLLPDNDALVAALRGLDGVRAEYADRLRAFRDTYAPRDDGGAADRVLDGFFGSRLRAGR